MKGKHLGSYVSKNGNRTFRYAVTGTPEQLAAFKEAMGEFYLVDETTGEVIWRTTRYAGEEVKLEISRNGRVYVDNSEIEKLKSLAAQHDGPVGDAIAAQIAKQLIANASVKTASVPAPAATDISKL